MSDGSIWSSDDKGKAMVVVTNGHLITTTDLETLIQTLACGRTVSSVKTYCHAQREKLNIGRRVSFTEEDEKKVLETARSSLLFTTPLFQELINTLSPGHSVAPVRKRCARTRSTTRALMHVERKRKSALCL